MGVWRVLRTSVSRLSSAVGRPGRACVGSRDGPRQDQEGTRLLSFSASHPHRPARPRYTSAPTLRAPHTACQDKAQGHTGAPHNHNRTHTHNLNLSRTTTPSAPLPLLAQARINHQLSTPQQPTSKHQNKHKHISNKTQPPPTKPKWFHKRSEIVAGIPGYPASALGLGIVQ